MMQVIKDSQTYSTLEQVLNALETNPNLEYVRIGIKNSIKQGSIENYYKPDKGFYYKHLPDKNFWKISVNKEDHSCSMWVFNAEVYSLNQCLDKILDNEDFILGIIVGYEHPEPEFFELYQPIIDNIRKYE